jgi:hypothetical protein
MVNIIISDNSTSSGMNISISYLLFRDLMKDFCLLGFGLVMYEF